MLSNIDLLNLPCACPNTWLQRYRLAHLAIIPGDWHALTVVYVCIVVSRSDVIKVSTKTLLEEPRAELTALHTLRLLPPSGLIDQVPYIVKIPPSLAAGNLTKALICYVTARLAIANLACHLCKSLDLQSWLRRPGVQRSRGFMQICSAYAARTMLRPALLPVVGHV